MHIPSGSNHAHRNTEPSLSLFDIICHSIILESLLNLENSSTAEFSSSDQCILLTLGGLKTWLQEAKSHSQSIASPKRQFFMLMIPDGCWCLLWKTALPRSEWLQHPNSWPGNQRGTLVVVKVSNVFECMGSAFTFWRLEVQLAKLCKSFSLRNQQKVTSSSDTKVIQ